ncbi:MAG: NUDIX domain-containing protein [Burkholderiaceae bacterium]
MPESPPLSDQSLLEAGTARSVVFEGKLLRVLRDDVSLPDSSSATREYIVHPGAVMVIPLLDDGRVVLERQFRYPVGRVMIEFPAGKLDAGEPSLSCAIRELKEETGYSAQEWAFAGVIHPVISYSTEHIDIWFARGLTAGSQALDQGEFLDVDAVASDVLFRWCLEGRVTDAKTLAGAFLLQNVLNGIKQLRWASADDASQPTPHGPYCPQLIVARP